MAGRVTLQTIADALGVSRTTVSNAYNRPDQLAPELRAAILEKAAELGYAGPGSGRPPPALGQAPRRGADFSARLSYAVTDPAAIALLQGLTEATEAKGYELLLLPGQRGTGIEVDSVREAVVGAFCLYCMPDDHPALKAALERRLPVVVVDEPKLPGTFFVGIEDRAGARAAAGAPARARARARRGDRRPPARRPHGRPDHRRGADRRRVLPRQPRADRGVLRRPRRAGARLRDRRETTPAAGSRAPEALLALSPRPTALLCASDQLALGAIEAIRAAGLDVPGDVAVVGYDDVPDAARAGLTTVRQPLLEKGREAGRLLLQPNTEREVILPVSSSSAARPIPPPERPTGRSRGPCRCSARGTTGSRRRPGRSSRGR